MIVSLLASHYPNTRLSYVLELELAGMITLMNIFNYKKELHLMEADLCHWILREKHSDFKILF